MKALASFSPERGVVEVVLKVLEGEGVLRGEGSVSDASQGRAKGRGREGRKGGGRRRTWKMSVSLTAAARTA